MADDLETVRLGFNAAADGMNAAGAALVADGGADVSQLLSAFNLAAIRLNQAGALFKKVRDNRKRRVRVSFVGIGIAVPYSARRWTGTVVERSTALRDRAQRA